MFPGMTKASIERLTEYLIKSSQPDVLLKPKPFNIMLFTEIQLTDLPEYSKIDCEYRNDLPPDIYGYTDVEKQTIYLNETVEKGDRKKRFIRSTIGHETGHAVMHIPIMRRMKAFHKLIQKKDDDKVRLYRNETIPLYRNPEWQAWHFAKAILMPRKTLNMLLCDGIFDLDVLADIYNVNPAFARKRLDSL